MPVIISELKPESPLEKAGVNVGSVILAINNVAINKNGDIFSAKEQSTDGLLNMVVLCSSEVRKIELPAGALGILANEIDIKDLRSQLEDAEYALFHQEWANFTQAANAGVDPDRLKNMILTTTPDIPNRMIVEIIEVVTAESVFGVNVIKEIFGDFTDTFGGRSKNQQKILREARVACLRELKIEAALVGADGVVGIDLDYSEISGGHKQMLFLVASGTAVKLDA